MDVRRIASEAMQFAKLKDVWSMNEVLARGRFLFGPEIQKGLEELHRLCIGLETNDPCAVIEINEKFDELITQFEPYLRMPQKVPRTF
jgi:hypothetical protein